MGRTALISHSKNKRYQMLEVTRQKNVTITYHFPTKSSKTTEPSVISASTLQVPSTSDNLLQCYWNETCSSTNTSTIDKYKLKDPVPEAEILWCINMVMNHRSLRSDENSYVLCIRMFPDAIARDIKLHKDNVS